MDIRGFRTILVGIVVGSAVIAAGGQSALNPQQATGSHQASSVPMTRVVGPNRPANVPEGYVITPFGYFHPSCVQNLVKGERLMADGRIQHANGNTDEKAAVCSYPHYLASENSKNLPGGTATPEINGWVENANITTGYVTESYGALIATWTVPPHPRANDGQVLYFFPGLEDIQDPQTSILQPVLGWYQGQWTLASWNCCLNGIITNSPAVSVNPGDEIYGSITNTCPPGTLSCPTWNVLSVDLSTGENTTLSNTPSQGQVFNWAFGGVLEAYYVVACDDLPGDRQISFDRVTVFDQDLNPLRDQFWSKSVDSKATPSCNYHVRPLPHKVTLTF